MSCIEQHKKGEVLYRAGSFEMWMYLIVSGCVKVVSNLGTEDEVVLSTVPAGEYFGQIEVVEGLPRTASIVVSEDCELEKIDGEEFGSYFEKHPVECMKIIRQMCSRLKELYGQFDVVCDTIDSYIASAPEERTGLFAKLAGLFK